MVAMYKHQEDKEADGDCTRNNCYISLNVLSDASEELCNGTKRADELPVYFLQSFEDWFTTFLRFQDRKRRRSTTIQSSNYR